MLVEQLALLGVQVERNTELINFTFAGSEVKAQIRKKSGEEETCRVSYLAGCDGTHSTVREILDVGFPGGTYADTYYVADIQATGPAINGELNLALDDADFLAIFPMKGAGPARLVGAVRKEIQHPQDLHWEDVGQTIIRHLNINIEEVQWFSSYRVHHRVASQFQKDNVFLLGDAAHIHSPVGGQGMNTGVGDAVNLGWKLAAVLKGESPASLLDTYEPERIAFARRLVATTDRAFAFVNARGRIATQVRTRIVPRLLPLLFKLTAVRRLLFKTISQIQIKYPNSPLSRGPTGTFPGGHACRGFNSTIRVEIARIISLFSPRGSGKCIAMEMRHQSYKRRAMSKGYHFILSRGMLPPKKPGCGEMPPTSSVLTDISQSWTLGPTPPALSIILKNGQ